MVERHSHRPLGERLIDSPWRILLFPLWLLYRPLVAMRNLCYDRGWICGRRLSVPVISVGNLIVGGSGKTPLVQWLCQRLSDTHQVHVLSRGYRGDGEANDEARLFSVPVHCDPRRWRSGRQAITEGAGIILLDDGFQHRQLQRDCDIVLIDATRPWGRRGGGRGATLPLGFLREHPRALARCDLIIITRSDQVDNETLAQLQTRLQRSGKPVLCASHQPSRLSYDNQDLPLDRLRDLPVVCVSGIANPQAFEDSVTALGCQTAAQMRFADHHHYTASDCTSIASLAAQHRAIVLCTSKDSVKLQSLWSPELPPLYTLHIALQFSADDEARLLQTISSCTEQHT